MKYSLTKNAAKIQKINLNCNKLDGYKFKPKNKIKYNGIEVNEMMVINTSFVEKLLKRKIQRKLEAYLKYIMEIIDSDDSDAGKLAEALNDLEKYNSIVNNNYRKYLEDKYINILNKKMELLKQELKSKLFTNRDYIMKQYEMMCNKNNYEEVETKGKSR